MKLLILSITTAALLVAQDQPNTMTATGTFALAPSNQPLCMVNSNGLVTMSDREKCQEAFLRWNTGCKDWHEPELADCIRMTRTLLLAFFVGPTPPDRSEEIADLRKRLEAATALVKLFGDAQRSCNENLLKALKEKK